MSKRPNAAEKNAVRWTAATLCGSGRGSGLMIQPGKDKSGLSGAMRLQVQATQPGEETSGLSGAVRLQVQATQPD
ncbi:MAG: hypothetical protein WCB14_02065 [Candidatus Acidiferrales bacterium]